MDPTTIDFSSRPPATPADDALTLAHYAERAYLEYALSVVKGRALPDVCDGQKPVQRRILYAMQRMGLTTQRASNGATGGASRSRARASSATCSAASTRTATPPAYDALVRMAQDFSLRYPLIDGQGNFGSPRRRRRRGDALHRGAPGADRAAAARRDRRGHGRLRAQLRRLDRGAAPAAARACRSCCSTARPASPSAWPPRCPATTCARSPRRRSR